MKLYVDVVFRKLNELLDGNTFRADPCAASFRRQRWVCGKHRKTAVPHCEERPEAADSREDDACVAGWWQAQETAGPVLL